MSGPTTTTPVALKVRLPFSSPEELLQRYGAHLSGGGVYLRAKTLHPPGTPLSFELKLQSGERVINASAVVAFVTGARGEGLPGMGIRFLTLDAASRRFLDMVGATLPHARSTEPPVPRNVGAPDYSPDAVPPPGPAPSQAPPTLPSEQAGRLVVAGAGDQALEAPPFEPDAEPPWEGPVVGIDLGTTNTCVAIVRDGKPVVLRSSDGQGQIPSVVALTPRGKLLVGGAAKAQALTNPRLTVSGFKRLLGRPYDAPEVADMVRRFAWQVVPTATGECAVQLGNRVYALEEISALVLREVRRLAGEALGQPVHRAVITVPAWYNDTQRHAVREAGRLAGLHVERIVNEPTAAALCYGYGHNLRKRVLVYDLGGGTFDASVLELQDTVYEVVSTGGDTFLGGMDFDNVIVAWLMAEFERATDSVFTDRVALSRVADAAERAKILLSERAEARINVPFVTMVADRPADLDVTMSRDQLIQLTHGLVDKTMEVCQEVLRARSIRADEIDEILLVGGQSKAPLVQERIALLFGREPVPGVNPEEAVALGAARLAQTLDTREGLLLIDVLPMSIGVGLPGGRFHPVLPRNTALPATRKHRVVARQGALELHIFQGESTIARGNTYLGTLVVPELRPGEVVELTFELSSECLLTLYAREESSGAEVSATFATRDTPEQVRDRLRALEAELPEPAPTGFFAWLRRLFSSS